MTMLTNTEVAVIEARCEAAREMIRALCSPRGTEGARSWTMTIPARDDDPDLVIAASVNDVPRLLAERAALRALLREYLTAFARLRLNYSDRARAALGDAP